MATVADKPGLDPTLPDVVLKLGGVERHLCFDFNALVQAERSTGLNLLTAIVSDINAAKLRGLLWAALLKESPELTEEQVGAFLTPFNMQVVHAAIVAAWFGSITDEQTNESQSPKSKAQAKKLAV